MILYFKKPPSDDLYSYCEKCVEKALGMKPVHKENALLLPPGLDCRYAEADECCANCGQAGGPEEAA